MGLVIPVPVPRETCIFPIIEPFVTDAIQVAKILAVEVAVVFR